MYLNYEQPLYRPPSEADNLILQVTIGCRFNQCRFCSMYRSKNYREKTLDEIEADILTTQKLFPQTRRIFLADGDAFNLSSEKLHSILQRLGKAFPKLSRVSCYATPANILAKTHEELILLKQHKLSLLYVGVETGNNEILKRISKGASNKSIIRALKSADEAGIKISATVILGLGGQQRWQQHINDTAALFSLAPVSYLSTLQLYLDDDSRGGFYQGFDNSFEHQDDNAILFELATLIDQIEPPKPVIFRSNHASNALALAGNLPRDKTRLLNEVKQTLASGNNIRPEYLRSL